MCIVAPVPFVSSNFFLLPWLWQLPSRPGVSLLRRVMQFHSWGRVSSLLFCACLIASLRFSLFLQCTHMSNLCMEPHRLHPSSCLVWPASLSLRLPWVCLWTSSLFSLLVVGTSSQSIHWLLWHKEACRSLGAVSLSMVVLVGITCTHTSIEWVALLPAGLYSWRSNDHAKHSVSY